MSKPFDKAELGDMSQYIVINSDIDKQKRKLYNVKNKEYKQKYAEKYYQGNRENLLQWSREWYKIQMENGTRRQYNKGYYAQNKEECLQRGKKYFANHKKERYQYRNQRVAVDPVTKVAGIARNRLSVALRERGIKKESKTKDLIGCDFIFLRTYIESQFQPGMSWDNHGEWHIDHIRPVSTFDLTNETELKKCFNYTNLQPLWAKDNLSKNNKHETKKNTPV